MLKKHIKKSFDDILRYHTGTYFLLSYICTTLTLAVKH